MQQFITQCKLHSQHYHKRHHNQCKLSAICTFLFQESISQEHHQAMAARKKKNSVHGTRKYCEKVKSLYSHGLNTKINAHTKGADSPSSGCPSSSMIASLLLPTQFNVSVLPETNKTFPNCIAQLCGCSYSLNLWLEAYFLVVYDMWEQTAQLNEQNKNYNLFFIELDHQKVSSSKDMG